MRSRIHSLLRDLHAHVASSDGSMPIRQIVDPHGGRGFDVLCIIGHTLRGDESCVAPETRPGRGVRCKGHALHAAEIARRA
jgi:predicted metal-dependent phosphoesterase TrpH